jgi:hypothetical protein
MEVILKKTKITNSIINQTLIAGSFDLLSFEILGFCVVKKYKWIILYKSSTNELRKYPYIKDVYYDDNKNYDTNIRVRVNFEGKINDITYISETENLLLFKKIKEIKNNTILKGQFYI